MVHADSPSISFVDALWPTHGAARSVRAILLALLGSAERALYLAERIQAERRSVSRELPQLEAVPNRGLILGNLSPEGA